jgi:hypothetical protein
MGSFLFLFFALFFYTFVLVEIFFFAYTEVLIPGLMLARQSFYHISLSTGIFAFKYFPDRVSHLLCESTIQPMLVLPQLSPT